MPPSQQHRLQYDSCYQLAEMGRVSAEMVRPIVTPRNFGGYDIESLRIGSLARTILIRLKHPAVVRICVCLTYARHTLIEWTCVNPVRAETVSRDHWVLARLHPHLLLEGRTYFMCYVMSLMFVHNTHPHAHALPTLSLIHI